RHPERVLPPRGDRCHAPKPLDRDRGAIARAVAPLHSTHARHASTVRAPRRRVQPPPPRSGLPPHPLRPAPPHGFAPSRSPPGPRTPPAAGSRRRPSPWATPRPCPGLPRAFAERVRRSTPRVASARDESTRLRIRRSGEREPADAALVKPRVRG